MPRLIRPGRVTVIEGDGGSWFCSAPTARRGAAGGCRHGGGDVRAEGKFTADTRPDDNVASEIGSRGCDQTAACSSSPSSVVALVSSFGGRQRLRTSRQLKSSSSQKGGRLPLWQLDYRMQRKSVYLSSGYAHVCRRCQHALESFLCHHALHAFLSPAPHPSVVPPLAGVSSLP